MAELNHKKKIPRTGPWALAGAILLLAPGVHDLGLGQSPPDPVSRDLPRPRGLFRFDAGRPEKTTVLMCDFDSAVGKVFGVLHSSAKQLASCRGCWPIAASGKVHDKKYHAGASALVDRKSTWIRAAAPDFLKTNIETVAMGVGRQTL